MSFREMLFGSKRAKGPDGSGSSSSDSRNKGPVLVVIMLTSIVTAFVSVALTLLVVSASSAPTSKSEAREKKASVASLPWADQVAHAEKICEQYPDEEVCEAFKNDEADANDVLNCFRRPEDFEKFIKYARDLAEEAEDLGEFTDDFVDPHGWCPKPELEFMDGFMKKGKLVKMEDSKAQVKVDKVAAISAGIAEGVEQILMTNLAGEEKKELKEVREELDAFMTPIRDFPGVDKYPDLQSEAAGITVGVFNLAIMATKAYELNARTALKKECDGFKGKGMEILPRRCYYVMAQLQADELKKVDELKRMVLERIGKKEATATEQIKLHCQAYPQCHFCVKHKRGQITTQQAFGAMTSDSHRH